MSEKLQWIFSVCYLEMRKEQSSIFGLMTRTQFSILPAFNYIPAKLLLIFIEY
ncbi:hypothetical protein SSUD9_0835 [Streptococcus suis D9]|nr:hypothetical protein SSUD9_0835 [Streptococcus suis D9]